MGFGEDPAGGPGREPGDEELWRVVNDGARSIGVSPDLVESGRRAGRWPAVDRGLVAPVLLGAALVAAVAGLAGCSSPARTPSASPGAAASIGQTAPSPAPTSPAPTTSSAPSSPAASATPAAAAPDLAAHAWYAMSAFSGCPANVPPEPLWQCSGGGPARPGYLELYAGTLDGRTPVRVDRPLPVSARLWVGRGSAPSASGPFGTKVLYWFYDGGGSELHAVDAVTGKDDTVLAIPDLVYGAVLDPATGTVYFGELDAARRRDRGVWRLVLGSGAPPSRLLPPGQHTYAGPHEWVRQLYLTPDGTRLVVLDCQDLACAVSVNRATDGARLASATGQGGGGAFGVTDADLLGGLGCPVGCSVGALGLATGQLRALTADPCAGSGTGVVGGAPSGSPLLLISAATGAGCGPEGTVLTVDPTTSGVGTAWSGAAPDPAGATLGLAFQGEGAQGYAVPSGWVLLAPDGDLPRTNHTGSLQPLLVSLSGGADVPVPVQPSFTH